MAIAAKPIIYSNSIGFGVPQEVFAEEKLEKYIKSELESAYFHFVRAANQCWGLSKYATAGVNSLEDAGFIKSELTNAKRFFKIAKEYDKRVEKYAIDIEGKVIRAGNILRGKKGLPLIVSKKLGGKEGEVIKRSEDFAKHIDQVIKMIDVILASDFRKILHTGYANPLDKKSSERMSAKFKFIKEEYEILLGDITALFELEGYCDRLLRYSSTL